MSSSEAAKGERSSSSASLPRWPPQQTAMTYDHLEKEVDHEEPSHQFHPVTFFILGDLVSYLDNYNVRDTLNFGSRPKCKREG